MPKFICRVPTRLFGRAHRCRGAGGYYARQRRGRRLRYCLPGGHGQLRWGCGSRFFDASRGASTRTVGPNGPSAFVADVGDCGLPVAHGRVVTAKFMRGPFPSPVEAVLRGPFKVFINDNETPEAHTPGSDEHGSSQAYLLGPEAAPGGVGSKGAMTSQTSRVLQLDLKRLQVCE